MEHTYQYTVAPESVALFADMLRNNPRFDGSRFNAVFGWPCVGSLIIQGGQVKYILEAPGGLAVADCARHGSDVYWLFILSSESDAAPIRAMQSGDPFAIL